MQLLNKMIKKPFVLFCGKAHRKWLEHERSAGGNRRLVSPHFLSALATSLVLYDRTEQQNKLNFSLVTIIFKTNNWEMAWQL